MNPKKDLGQKKQKQVRLSEDKKMQYKLDGKKKEMSTEFDAQTHLVLDLGNALTKIGYSGNDLPSVIIPSIYAKNNLSDPDKKNELLAYDQKLEVFGYEALDEKYQGQYEIQELTPGDSKLDTSENFVELLKEILERQMQITESDYKVIINISPIMKKENIDSLLKYFFEDLQFKELAMVNNASLSLFSTGRTSGMVVQCGETRTYTVPIYEGFPLRHGLSKNSVGGKHLTAIFQKGVEADGVNIKPYDIKVLREIKEKTCFVPFEEPYDAYLSEDHPDIIPMEKRLFKLPDEKETIIPIPRKYRIEASELLFNPSLYEFEKPEVGLSQLLFRSLNKAALGDAKFKDTLNTNIVLGGGTSMMPGLSERIAMDLEKNNMEDKDNCELSKPRVIRENNRYISKWVGMSMISSMSAFDKLFIEKSKYGELGEDRSAILGKIF